MSFGIFSLPGEVDLLPSTCRTNLYGNFFTAGIPELQYHCTPFKQLFLLLVQGKVTKAFFRSWRGVRIPDLAFWGQGLNQTFHSFCVLGAGVFVTVLYVQY